MKRAIALVLCLIMVLPLVFTGCSKSDDEDKGAYIQMYISSEIYNFDPVYSYTDDATTKLFGLIYEGLFRMNDDGKVEKALCKDYKVTEDPESGLYQMQISINETGWSDGRAVSVDDVIFAWKRILDPEYSSPAASMLFDIKNARNYKNGDCSPDDVGLYPVDTTVFVIEFEKSINYDLFIENLCSPLLVPLREDALAKAENWASNVAIMVANGPFAVRSFTPGEKLALQRNGYYYRDIDNDAIDSAVRPYRIYVNMGVDAGGQLGLYNDGKVFYDSEIQLSARKDWASKAEVLDMQSVHSFVFNTTNPLFEKAEVRKALSMALDRQAIADLVVFADPATGLITNGIFNTSRKDSFRKVGGELISKTGDIEGAKSLIKSSGAKTGDFKIKVRNNEVDLAIAEYAKEAWKKLGYNVTIEKLTYKKGKTENEYDYFEDLFNTAFTTGDFDVAAIDFNMFSTDAFSTLASFAVGFSGTAINLSNPEEWDPKPGITGYNNEKYNELIGKAYEAESDRSARAGFLHDAEKQLMEDMPIIPVVFLKNAYIASKKISKYDFDFWGCPEFTNTKLSKYELYTNCEKTEE